MSGHGSARIATFTVDKTVSGLDLIPDASATIYRVSDALCDNVKGMGITGTLKFKPNGGGDFASQRDEVEWTSGTTRAEVLASFVPSPLGAFVSLPLEGDVWGLRAPSTFPPRFGYRATDSLIPASRRDGKGLAPLPSLLRLRSKEG